ncbi:MAG: hypothetical protein HOQ24_00860 [Mycobacteriaceae bacterium]|nr:hypothetical protein [Mycobacteriaceae bacterium]
MESILQIVGAVLVLAGFAGSQMGRLDPDSLLYLAVNTIGAGILAVLALLERQWGFLLLEGVWTIVAVVGLVRVATVAKAA